MLYPENLQSNLRAQEYYYENISVSLPNYKITNDNNNECLTMQPFY